MTEMSSEPLGSHQAQPFSGTFGQLSLWQKKTTGKTCCLEEATTRFELVIRVLQTLALPLGHVALKSNADCERRLPIMHPIYNLRRNQQSGERAMGFEPTTFSLARRRTTAVLRPRIGSLRRRECRESESN
jgi:hypothetical protein